MNENFITIPSSLQDAVKITREPLAGNGWGATVITVPTDIKVAFEKTRSELNIDEVNTLINLVNKNVSEFTEEFATKLNDGFDGTSTDSIASAERGLNRIKYLEGLRDKLVSQYVDLEKENQRDF